MKKINTTVSTGDMFEYAGKLYTVGTCRKHNGKNEINLSHKLSETSVYTIQVSTIELNKMIANSVTKP